MNPTTNNDNNEPYNNNGNNDNNDNNDKVMLTFKKRLEILMDKNEKLSEKINEKKSVLYYLVLFVHLPIILATFIGLFVGLAFKIYHVNVCINDTINFQNNTINFQNNTLTNSCYENMMYVSFSLCTICSVLTFIMHFIYYIYDEKFCDNSFNKNKCVLLLIVHTVIVLAGIAQFIYVLINSKSAVREMLISEVKVVYAVMAGFGIGNSLSVFQVNVYYICFLAFYMKRNCDKQQSQV